MPDLNILELLNCPINNIENYRDEVFKALPNLKVLDMQFKTGSPYETEDDEGILYFII